MKMRSLRQRGASLTGYALIMSGMVAVSLGAVQGLDRGSTDVLEATGDSIGEARPTRDELALVITEEDPDDGSLEGPPPGPTPTYSWQSDYTGIIQTTNGFCIADTSGAARTENCSTGASGSMEFFDNADDDNDQVQIRVNGLCVTRIGTNQPAALASCQDGNDDQMWLQTPSGNLANGGAPGECLDIDAFNAGAAGAQVFVWGCHGGSNQTFSFPGPYVPPVAAVTSVLASNASLTGAFQLDGGGYISAPDGTGRNLTTAGTLGTATFTFAVPAAGQYKINGSVFTGPGTGSDDSFWVTTSLDGHSSAHAWGISGGLSPHDDFVNTDNGGPDLVLDVPAGGETFSIIISVREDGASLGSLNLVAL